MKKEIIHYSRFIFPTESACGLELGNELGIVLHSNTIDRKQVTCKNCLRKIQKDAKG